MIVEKEDHFKKILTMILTKRIAFLDFDCEKSYYYINEGQHSLPSLNSQNSKAIEDQSEDSSQE